MKIILDREKDQIELVKAMASKNKVTAYEAQAALAELMGPVIAEVVNNAPTVSNLFTTLTYQADDNPSIPLDLYHDILDEDYIKVYSQSVPGGLPTNYVQPTMSELKFTPYRLDSAYSFDRKYAAKSRLDVVGKTFTRMAQEVLLKRDRTAANMIFTALAEAATGKEAFTARNRHVFRTAQANRFLLDDLNKLFTKAKRINSSFVSGTPVGSRKGLTDLLVSPEIVEYIRALSYNPINTLAPNGAAVGGTSQPIALPDAERMAMFNNAGINEFYGVAITEIYEMGLGKRFNDIFDNVAGSTDYLNHGSITASSVFDGSAEEIIVGIDRSRDSLLRAVATDSDTGSSFSLEADDQFVNRQKRIGYFGDMEEGIMILDVRVLVGLIV
jgi:hypothetical protein